MKNPKPVAKTVYQQNTLKEAPFRGAQSNTTARFNKNQTVLDLENYGWIDPEQEHSLLRTEFLEDHSKSIIAQNSSPDIGFTYSLNSYRGCEHGCIYCFARPTHEYFNLSAGLDFESKIFVKHSAPILLREKLSSKSWVGETVFMSGVTDCYQPAENRFKLTRQCLEIFLEFRNPVVIITKNQLIRRDIEILKKMSEYNGVKVYLSITSLDDELIRKLEPRTSTPKARLNAIQALAKEGIPVGVNVAPIIPGLTDHELPEILRAASEAGATSAGYVPVRLPLSVAPLFEEWLEIHFPDRKNKIVTAIKSIRDGKMNNAEFGSRMRGEGPRADLIASTFDLFTKRYKLNEKNFQLANDSFRKPKQQLSFDLDDTE